ncbi:hypothetical protein AB4K20DRAFT_1869898 [Rhizopus microsporus]
MNKDEANAKLYGLRISASGQGKKRRRYLLLVMISDFVLWMEPHSEAKQAGQKKNSVNDVLLIPAILEKLYQLQPIVRKTIDNSYQVIQEPEDSVYMTLYMRCM